MVNKTGPFAYQAGSNQRDYTPSLCGRSDSRRTYSLLNRSTRLRPPKGEYWLNLNVVQNECLTTGYTQWRRRGLWAVAPLRFSGDCIQPLCHPSIGSGRTRKGQWINSRCSTNWAIANNLFYL